MKKILLSLLLISNCCFAGVAWEHVNFGMMEPSLWRLWVPHGWILCGSSGVHEQVTFYQDENHDWKL